MSKNPIERVNEIDLLRFFAAFSVVIYHYSVFGAFTSEFKMSYPFLASVASFGFYGVNLFFMISGFVILMTASQGGVIKFIISRITRLYPAYWFCCTVTFLFMLAFMSPLDTNAISNYMVNMTMFNELFKVPAIDGSYWTLFVEIQFYFFITVILLFKKINNVQPFLILWLLITALLLPFEYGKFHRIFMTDYSSYFSAGAVLYLIWKQGLSAQKVFILSLAYILAICKIFIQTSDHYIQTQSHLIIASIIVSVFFVILLCIATKSTGNLSRLEWVKLGAMTYPLYLIHQTVGLIIIDYFHKTINLHILFWGTVLVMLLFSFLVSQYIEKSFAKFLKIKLNVASDYLVSKYKNTAKISS